MFTTFKIQKLYSKITKTKSNMTFFHKILPAFLLVTVLNVYISLMIHNHATVEEIILFSYQMIQKIWEENQKSLGFKALITNQKV